MAKFKFEINVRPDGIPNLDDAHKRDCSDAVKKAIGGVFKYTLIFAAATAAFYALYIFFGLLWLLRMETLLPQISALIPLTAAAVFLVEFAAGTMNKFAIVLEILLLAFIVILSVMTPASLIIIPFALYGLVRHIQLIALIPFYKVLSSLPGYPNFTPLPTADEVRKKPENTGNSETKEKNENTVEGNGNMSGNEKGNEENISRKSEETTVLPQETTITEISEQKENVRKKKKGNKNRNKKRSGK